MPHTPTVDSIHTKNHILGETITTEQGVQKPGAPLVLTSFPGRLVKRPKKIYCEIRVKSNKRLHACVRPFSRRQATVDCKHTRRQTQFKFRRRRVLNVIQFSHFWHHILLYQLAQALKYKAEVRLAHLNAE